MVLISVQSVETNNGYQFKNDFSETIEIDPKASVSVVNALFEREDKFVVTTENNIFDIGLSTDAPTQIVIPEGSYTGAALAEAIQYALYLNYGELGIYFSVTFSKGKPNNFIIEYSYEAQDISIHAPQNINTVGAEVVISDLKAIDFGNITTVSSNYALTQSPIETTIVPNVAQGGSFIEARINQTGTQALPVAPVVESSWLIGLTSGKRGLPAAGAVVIDTNIVDIGIVFFKRADGTTSVKFIENGTETTSGAQAWEVKDNDTYKILLAPDGASNTGGPEYWYKRDGGRYRKFDVGSHVNENFWGGKFLQPIFGADYPDVGGAGPIWWKILYTPAGVNMLPQKLNLTLTDHTYSNNNLLRDYSAVGYVADNVGGLTELINSNVSSQLIFSLSMVDKTKYSTCLISILDENQRLVNVGQTATEIMGNPFYGNTTDNVGNALTDGTTNPALLSFEFDKESQTVYRRETTNDFSNQQHYKANALVRPNRQPINTQMAVGKWSADTVFKILILAEADEVVITCNETGSSKPEDDIIIYQDKYLNTVSNGAKTISIINAGVGWTDATDYWFYLDDPTNSAVVQVTGQADGTLTNPILIKSGKGFTAAATYDSFPIIIDSGFPLSGVTLGTTKPTFRVDALWDLDIPTTNNYSTSWKTTGTNGYRWLMTIPDWEGASTDAQSGLTVKSFSIQGGAKSAPVVKFIPRVLPAFGDLIGFNKSIYTFDEAAQINSDGPINALAGKDENISINIDNLPIKSYIGKGYLQNSTINTAPLGSQQGITRTVAVIPRSHEENGNAGTGTVGPYYYDYFPYSIPLHNAVELNVNELEITLKNRDGTLATDITKTSLLLNISKVDNMGEGSMGGGIGNPIKAGRNYDRLDIDKTLRVGNMAPIGNKLNGALRHERADFSNSATGSGKDKTYAI